MKYRFSALLAAVIILFTLIPRTDALAATYEFDSRNVNITVRDDVLIMTPDTSKYDEVWMTAGVTDPSAKIKEFNRMGVAAAFYDPVTSTTVSFISKHTQDTVDLYTFTGMTDDQIIEYITGAVGAGDEASADVSVVTCNGIRFFRLELIGQSSTAVGHEIIYGTAENGQILQLDIYSANETGLDEGFLKEVASGLSFTRFITREEYAIQSKAAARKFLIGVGIFFGLIILLIVYAIVHKRKQKKKLQQISDSLSDFKNRRKNGQVDDSSPLYVASSVYDDLAIDNFTTFNTWIQTLPVLLPSALLYIVIIYMMMTNGQPMIALLTVVAGIVLLYMHYNRLEKLKAVQKKQLNISSKPVITARFYPEFFTVNGLGSPTEYPLLQITSVREWKEYIFIYTGADNAVILRDIGVEDGKYKELVSFLKKKR